MNVFKVLCVLMLSLCLWFGCSDSKVIERKSDSYLEALHNSHGNPNDLHPGSGPSYPSPTYGVVPHYPAPSPVYPAAYGPPGPLQAPRGDWLWEKFHLKFDLFTLGKILLKLLIFKKIVKFIGVICLLMFLPTLIEKKAPASDNDGYGEEMFRSASSSEPSKLLNDLTTFVLSSIDSYAAKQANHAKESDSGQ